MEFSFCVSLWKLSIFRSPSSFWVSKTKARLPTECPNLGRRALEGNMTNVLTVTSLKAGTAHLNSRPNGKATSHGYTAQRGPASPPDLNNITSCIPYVKEWENCQRVGKRSKRSSFSHESPVLETQRSKGLAKFTLFCHFFFLKKSF